MSELPFADYAGLTCIIRSLARNYGAKYITLLSEHVWLSRYLSSLRTVTHIQGSFRIMYYAGTQ